MFYTKNINIWPQNISIWPQNIDIPPRRNGSKFWALKYQYLALKYQYLGSKYQYLASKYRYLASKYWYLASRGHCLTRGQNLTICVRFLPLLTPQLLGPRPNKLHRIPISDDCKLILCTGGLGDIYMLTVEWMQKTPRFSPFPTDNSFFLKLIP